MCSQAMYTIIAALCVVPRQQCWRQRSRRDAQIAPPPPLYASGRYELAADDGLENKQSKAPFHTGILKNSNFLIDIHKLLLLNIGNFSIKIRNKTLCYQE